MIPLTYFILAWFFMIGLYAVVAFLTVEQMFRHGTAGFMAYISTFLFLATAVFVVSQVCMYLQGVDWNAGLLMPILNLSFIS